MILFGTDFSDNQRISRIMKEIGRVRSVQIKYHRAVHPLGENAVGTEEFLFNCSKHGCVIGTNRSNSPGFPLYQCPKCTMDDNDPVIARRRQKAQKILNSWWNRLRLKFGNNIVVVKSISMSYTYLLHWCLECKDFVVLNQYALEGEVDIIHCPGCVERKKIEFQVNQAQ